MTALPMPRGVKRGKGAGLGPGRRAKRARRTRASAGRGGKPGGCAVIVPLVLTLAAAPIATVGALTWAVAR